MEIVELAKEALDAETGKKQSINLDREQNQIGFEARRAKRLNDAELVIIDKRRPKPNESQVMNVIGDVSGRTCLIVDDLVDTANTLCEAAHALKEQGAKRVLSYCVHPVLSGRAIERISGSELDELVVTDTIPLSDAARACKRIRQLSVAPLMAETMRRISEGDSVSSLFVE